MDHRKPSRSLVDYCHVLYDQAVYYTAPVRHSSGLEELLIRSHRDGLFIMIGYDTQILRRFRREGRQIITVSELSSDLIFDYIRKIHRHQKLIFFSSHRMKGRFWVLIDCIRAKLLRMYEPLPQITLLRIGLRSWRWHRKFLERYCSEEY